MSPLPVIVFLLFHNHFFYYDIVFQGCRFEGELTSPPPWRLLQTLQTQEFQFESRTGFTSGNCTYYIPVLRAEVDFQWYYNARNGHEFYGITAHPQFDTFLTWTNKINYYVSDL